MIVAATLTCEGEGTVIRARTPGTVLPGFIVGTKVDAVGMPEGAAQRIGVGASVVFVAVAPPTVGTAGRAPSTPTVRAVTFPAGASTNNQATKAPPVPSTAKAG